MGDSFTSPMPELLTHAIGHIRPDEADELSLVARFRELSPKRKSDVWMLIELLSREK